MLIQKFGRRELLTLSLEKVAECLFFINICQKLKGKSINEEKKIPKLKVSRHGLISGGRGLRLFLSGISNETFQEHRSRLRETTEADLKRVADKYLSQDLDGGRVSISVMGPEQAAKTLDSTWTVQNLLG